MSKFYVTNAIPYVNAPPHIGYALEVVQSDALARWHRLIGDDTFFLVGTDENGLKVVKAAKEQGKKWKDLADEITPQFEKLSKALNLSADGFIRTSDQKSHYPGAQKMWRALKDAGYFYKDIYEGPYCVGCEHYYTEKDLVDGKCPIHKTPVEYLKEENYFFKLSAFSKQIIELIESGKYQILPVSRQQEILNVLKDGLHDVSFSRPADKLAVGVPVPDDPSQIIYVWCDALVNYLTGIGYGTDEKQFKRYWPADVHVIGKDIVRFHAAIWPAMLLAANLPLPKKLYVHGFITVEGEKMSKSIGNVIDPFEAVKTHGVDPLRYYLLTVLPYASDGDYSEHRFKEVYNSELANDLGNLASRVLTLVEKKCDGKVPDGTASQTLKEHIGQDHHELADLLDDCKFAEAIGRLNHVVSQANKFVDAKQPYKQEGQDLNDSLYTLVQVLGHLSLLYSPFIPEAAEKLQKQLGLKSTGWNAKTLLEWEKVKPGTKVSAGSPLFPKSA